MLPFLPPDWMLLYFPRTANPQFFMALCIAGAVLSIVFLVCLVLLWRTWRLYRREKQFDRVLRQKLADQLDMVPAAADTSVTDLASWSEGEPIEPPQPVAETPITQPEQTEQPTVVTLDTPVRALQASWERDTLSEDEQAQMRQRTAACAREWLAHEVQTGNLHPTTQSVVYNLLYSLKSAEDQVASLKNTSLHYTTVSGASRRKPRVKLVRPAE